MKIIFPLLLLILIFSELKAQNTDTIYLWPGNVPGETMPKQETRISENNSGEVTRIAQVTNPLLIVFEPENTKPRASIIICPGGGYHHLAFDKEGTEIAEWLNQLGIKAWVLQYRVPDNRTGALQDVQRAIRLVKQTVKNEKVGVMGFSAGGSLSARAAILFNKESYQPVDINDSINTKPDFAALIYPAYLDEGVNRSLTPELSLPDNVPPVFIFGTADDKYGNSSLVMATALRDHNIPVELHFLANGGHGYGLRPGNVAAETWPALLENWLNHLLAGK
ncbi:MAG: alpha/beta hydrolase [Prolixibacteraceae bacterium]|nr:alpha/beta hydrolase [Prolixibacteraceae bacterium]